MGNGRSVQGRSQLGRAGQVAQKFKSLRLLARLAKERRFEMTTIITLTFGTELAAWPLCDRCAADDGSDEIHYRYDSYEFDEVCANCGVLIPASAVEMEWCQQCGWCPKPHYVCMDVSWQNLAAVVKAEGWPK